ncbi:hypothetical protein OOK60_03380 [Trichothermofontia sichuanensis B231]|uniref:hypothetical protein n=1 Tax=Trichothermofontia sichuanensis TaxID=3045816 RepID=UPI002246BA23|nr:hypothetical protein [Trichothermofontia sichuanensis]UZQ55131.1 hypothetical protein OOK60_03380 [Trichothermofontia sichuanensis B231]
MTSEIVSSGRQHSQRLEVRIDRQFSLTIDEFWVRGVTEQTVWGKAGGSAPLGDTEVVRKKQAMVKSEQVKH